MTQPQTIHIAAAIINVSCNKTLLVRKKNSPFFMQPGGKIKENETPQQTLIRELKEEISFTVEEKNLQFIGEYEAEAANEKGFIVNAKIYKIQLKEQPIICINSEIEEIMWINLRSPPKVPIAELTLKLFSEPIFWI